MGSKRRRSEEGEETKDERKERKKLKKEKRKSREGNVNLSTTTSTITQKAASNDAYEYESYSSLFSKRTISLTISLLPTHLSHVQENLEDSIRSAYLLQYSPTNWNGVMLAFDNVTIQDNGRGRILHELPHIHYSVTLEALIFQPAPGMEIVGAISNDGSNFHSHLSLIVHGYFNASISAQQLRNATATGGNGFEFDDVTEQWYYPNTINNSVVWVGKGTQIRFRIERVHESGTNKKRRRKKQPLLGAKTLSRFYY
jgi:DNA-directed RNA polymerase subunit E'/Rpb7